MRIISFGFQTNQLSAAFWRGTMLLDLYVYLHNFQIIIYLQAFIYIKITAV